ncbi:glycine cleavage system protein T [Parasaccharibacter sp. TMW2.1890]|nr:glycine cleavage system protein T [Parasaccharibacter sp. TMW2.1890]
MRTLMKRNHLSRRSVISLTGNERTSFLNGLITNDVQALSQNGTAWAAMLNAQGRIQTLFFLWKTEEALLLDLPETETDSLLKTLRRFRLRADVHMERMDATILTGAPETPRPDGALIHAADPRHPALGWRAIIPGSPANDEAVQQREADALLARRLQTGIPGDEDIVPGQTLVLEANMDHLHGVSWTKGCYLGQEVTARTHYRGLIKKRLLPARSTDGQPLPDEGAVTLDGQEVGELRSHAGQHGLALLHRRAWNTSGLQLDGHPITLDWPDWLPRDTEQTQEKDS